MEAIAVRSSFIKGAAYNENRQLLRLTIGDKWYYYYGVTKQKMARFKKSPSKGEYFVNHIKGQYETIKRNIRTNQN